MPSCCDFIASATFFLPNSQHTHYTKHLQVAIIELAAIAVALETTKTEIMAAEGVCEDVGKGRAIGLQGLQGLQNKCENEGEVPIKDHLKDLKRVLWLFSFFVFVLIFRDTAIVLETYGILQLVSPRLFFSCFLCDFVGAHPGFQVFSKNGRQFI